MLVIIFLLRFSVWSFFILGKCLLSVFFLCIKFNLVLFFMVCNVGMVLVLFLFKYFVDCIYICLLVNVLLLLWFKYNFFLFLKVLIICLWDNLVFLNMIIKCLLYFFSYLIGIFFLFFIIIVEEIWYNDLSFWLFFVKIIVLIV